MAAVANNPKFAKKAGIPKLGMVTDPVDEQWPPPPLRDADDDSAEN